jgi:DNA ligase-1
VKIQFDRGGILLPDLDLWLDPSQRITGPQKVFVSHAHSDHVGAHREVLLSAPTAQLMRARLAGLRLEQILGFGEGHLFNGGAIPYRLTLVPAGHILGSAMAYVETEGESLLYTGDFKLKRGLAAEPCAPRQADVLIMETTFGQPHFQFPPAQTVMGDIIRFCRESLEQDATPVLLAYSLGKSQELLCGLAQAGLPIMLHEAVLKLTQIYEKFDVRFPKYEPLEPASAKGNVLIVPPNASRGTLDSQFGSVRTAIVSGWAIDPACRFRYQCDAAFPLSDHADFNDLIELVRQVSPRKVYTLHGFAADFAQSLRDLDFDAHALSEPDQLHFRFAAGK